MLKITLFLIAFSLFLISGNALFGLFENNPQFLIIDSDLNISDLGDVNVNSLTNSQILVFNSTTLQWENQNQAGATGTRTYTGIAPITVDNDGNLLGLNVTSTDDWNGTFDGFDRNDFTLNAAYSFDANRGRDSNVNIELKDLFFNVSGQSQADLTFPEIFFETQSPSGLGVSDSFITFKITGEAAGGNVGTFRIIDGAENNIVLIETERQSVDSVPTFQSVGWEPLDDNKHDLGAIDRRWKDLFLAGTIKGQGGTCDPELGCIQNFVFDLNGTSGNFDTVGDVNSLDLLVRSDLNNNAAGSDANFNRLEADFFFGDGSGLTNLPNGVTGIIEGGNIDVNSNTGDVLVSFDDGNFLSFNHLWPADQNFLRINVADLNAQDATFTTKGLVNINPRYLDVNNGELNFDTNTQDLLHFFNGTILETIDVDVNSNGTDVNLFIGREGGGDLTLVFNDGYFFFDTTPPKTITLTAGSDPNPTLNYVFIPNSTQVLTANTTGFPTDAEFAPIATVLVQSAASVVIDRVYKVHVWTDHSDDEDTHQGHESEINSWIRLQPGTWRDGVSQTLTITSNAGRPDSVDFAVTSGTVLQLHDHAYPAFDTASDSNIFVVNDSGAAFTKVDDLNALLTDSTGGSMTNRYFTLVVWGVVSEDSGDSKLMLNLPSGSYNKESDATADVSGFANFNIPVDFRGTGFLISKLVLRHQPASGGTWTSIVETDLRGLFPTTAAAGGSGAAVTEFPDNLFSLFNVSDSTKELRFDLSGITTANERLWTVQDANGTVPLLEFNNVWTVDQNHSRINSFDVNLQNLFINGIDFNIVYDERYSQADTNIFTSGVSDCNSTSFVFGFNSNGTIDCRTDAGGGGGLSEADANALYVKLNPTASQTITEHELILENDLNFTDSSGNPTGSWDNDANRICLGNNCQSFMDWNGTALIIGAG